MGITCEINFDQNEHGIYFAGQTVTGRVIITSTKAKTVKGIALKINGCARTKWTQNVGKNNAKNNKVNSKKKVQDFYGHEDYLASTTYLLGSSECETTEIKPGIHHFTFSCALPHHCPSSFEGREGHIRYTIKIALVRPWEFDQTYSKGFTVLKLKDLNYESPVLRSPAVQETHKTFFWGPCKTQPLKMSLSVPQTGYVPGQDVFVTVNVTNESSVPVRDLKISLVMLVILFSQSPTMQSRVERTNLVKAKEGPINSRTTRTMTQKIRVPATPTTCFNLCRIIKISYEIQVEAKLGGFHQNPLVTVPITIGNVPLSNVIQQQPMPRLRSLEVVEPSAPRHSDDFYSIQGGIYIDDTDGGVLPGIDRGQNMIDPLSSPDNNIPPPSYEESMHMARADCNEDDQHPLGQSEFLPRYPVYSVIEPSAPLENEPVMNTDPSKSTWL